MGAGGTTASLPRVRHGATTELHNANTLSIVKGKAYWDQWKKRLIVRIAITGKGILFYSFLVIFTLLFQSFPHFTKR